MPIQVLPAGSNWGATLGEGFGRGLSEGMRALANMKMQEYQQRQQGTKTSNAFKAMGIDPEKAEALAYAPETLQREYLKEYLQGPRKQAFAQGLGSLATGQPQSQGLEQLFAQMNPRDALALMQFQQDQKKQESTEQYRQQKLGHQTSEKEIQRAIELAQPLIKQYQTFGTAAKTMLPNLKLLSQLNQSGKLNKGIFGYQPVKTPETELFNSTVEQLLADADITGNENIRKLADSLKSTQSQQALQSRLDNLIKRYEEGSLYNLAADNVIAENGGVPPLNFQAAVEKKIQSYRKNGIPEAAQQGSDLEQMDQPFNLIDIPDQAQQQMAGQVQQQQLPGQQPLTPVQAIASATSPNPADKRTAMDILTEQARQNPIHPMQDLGAPIANIAARGLKGAAEGVTNLAALPFNAASFVTGGRVPVPSAVKAIEQAPENLYHMLPESITKSRSGTEEFIGDVVEDAASFLSPSGFLGTVGKGTQLLGKGSKWLDKAAKIMGVTPKAAATVSTAGNAAKWITSYLGGTENEQGLVKAGTMLAVPIVGTHFMGQKVASLGKQIANTQQPTSTLSRNSKLFDIMSKAFTRVSKLDESPAKEELLNVLETTFSKNPTFSDLWSLKHNVTRVASESDVHPTIKKAVGSLMATIDESLLKVSQKSPELHKLVDQYLDLNNAANTTSTIQNFVKTHLLKRAHSPVVGAALYSLGLTRPKLVPAAIGAYLSVGEAEKLARMALKSPTFRQVYGKFINAAILGDVNEANKALRGINQVMTRES